jgi:UDP-N-acetylglucosamine 1-carboxyvinyltransferase
MQYFQVQGSTKLKGTFYPKGNKNAALPIIAATLLSSEPVILKNLPEIEDVKIMLQIIEKLGAEVTRLQKNEYKIHVKSILTTEIDQELGRLVRTSILFAGPLLAKKKEAQLPRPGGDVIGKRRLDTHFDIFCRLGAEYSFGKQLNIKAEALKGCFIYLDEASVTATENGIMAAVCATGKTTIYNAACEPHVQDLCRFLNCLGAKISGIGTNRLEIEGVCELSGGTWEVISDHIEVGSIIALAAMTRSELTIENIHPEDYYIVQKNFMKLGVRFDILEHSIFIPSEQELKVGHDLDGSIASIADGIWPGFPSDLTSIAVVLATQVEGTILLFEKLFESRMFFTDKLVGMGAKIILCDPHRVVVSGPSKLYSGSISSPDIRAGMAMLIAALVANGESKIHNIRQIDRGYEAIDERLNALGANIVRVTEE